MDKLKKLGKYFTKGLQAGVLATALIAGNVSCSNSSGGSTVEYPIVTPPTLPKDDTESTWPSYYINKDFGGQQFVDYNLDANTFNKTKFDDSYKVAREFMATKVKELSNDIAGQTYIPMYEKIDAALKAMNKGNNIADNITNNYEALATVFADFEKNQLTNYSEAEIYDYKTSYYKLADEAYNESLTKLYAHQVSISFPANGDMYKGDSNSYFNNALAKANYDYDTLTVDEAKKCMKNTLNDIANQNGVDSNVLKKFVELALYNESLYGLNDYTNARGISTTLRAREVSDFSIAISEARREMQSLSYEDNGMTM
ncbi:MAG: hypothetical protein J1E59_01045 [Treponema sp.]|nr:hypothetical protein [Treponema sp.]